MARPGPGRAVAGWARRYALAPRYAPEEALPLTTADGVTLAAARLAGPDRAPATVVLVHGFTNWSRHPSIHAFARDLARKVHVIVPDLRGHGRSGGVCGMGSAEDLDVDAAVRAATPGLPVVIIGVSMGGVATLLHAGRYGGVEATFALSAPAAWSGLTTTGTKRVRRYVTTRSGRALLAVVARTRVGGLPSDVESAAGAVAAIAPATTVVVHDPDDRWFPPEHAERIYEWAAEPKELWWVPGAGHGVDMLTTALADRILDRIGEWQPDRGDAWHRPADDPLRRPFPSP